MKRLRKAIFITFITSTLAILAFAFWFFSAQPSKEQIAEAFPLNSYKTFSEGKKFTVYSLEPFSRVDPAERFQDVAVLGKTELHDKSFQKLLKHAFLNDSSTTLQGAACFNPRHGLSISDGKKSIDILICFECGNFSTYAEDKQGKGNLMGTSEVLFNKTLTDAGIQLSKDEDSVE